MKRITAVVLAAGQSKRMGEAKLLLSIESTAQIGDQEKIKTILDQTLLNVIGSAVDQTIVISGGYREEVEKIAASHHLTAIYNPRFADGEMLSSLQTAIRFLQSERDNQSATEGMMVVLGDMPFIQIETINLLIDRFLQRPDNREIVIPMYKGRAGHPVIFGNALFQELMALPTGGAPRDLIKANPQWVMRVESEDEAILHDIDTPDQYHAMVKEKRARANLG